VGKRIYSPLNKKLFQHREGGNYYCLISGSEISLETADFEQAQKNFELQSALVSKFGSKAFKYRVRDLFPAFLKKKKPEVRPGTLLGYEKIWKRDLEPGLGKLPIGDVNQKTWLRFCEKRTANDFQNHRNLMHQFLVWCEGQGYLLAVPTLKNPKHKRRRRKIIPPEHLAVILQEARGSLRLFLSLALFMGMRRSEILKLDWTRVNFDHRSLRLRDIDVKTDEERQIPITKVVLGLLAERLKEQQDAGSKTIWVFPHQDTPKKHMHLEGLMTAWRLALRRCGLAETVKRPGTKVGYKIVVQYTWHDFRATYEKYSNKANDFTDTQREKFSGADIDVQRKRYVSMDADDLRGLEEVVSKSLPTLALYLSDRNKTAGKTLENKNGATATVDVTPEKDA